MDIFAPLNEQGNTATLFADGGEMGRLMRARDWAATPLGPAEDWPQSLRTAVSICLASHFPMLIWWGPELVKLYNDAYALILGAKHPKALGQRGQDCWPEIWDIIGPMLEGVLYRGEATWSENQLLLLERNGYAEECYFTFSYSPIRDETGGIGGVFTAVTETTRQVLGERRLRTLRTLSATIAGTQTSEDVCQRAEEVLVTNQADVPFVLFYLLTPDGTQVNLAATNHFLRNTQAAPLTIHMADKDAPWPLEAVARTGHPVLVENLSALLSEQVLAGLSTLMPAPQNALVLPITQTGEEPPAGFLVAGLSPRRPLDEEYRGFLKLVTEQIATALVSAHAYQDAQARAEALAEIDRVKTAFFNNVSHEFRTPLTLSLGPLETLLSDPVSLTESQRELLHIVQRNSLRQLKLVNTLLDFSRLEAGRIEAAYEPVDLAAFTIDLASTFRSAIEKAGMILTVDCSPLDSPVYVDRQMWEKIVLNLLSNAFKYTFHGTITVRLEQKGTTVELTVQDTGVGIPASELPRIFDRFHRVRGTEGRTYEGTGIGLSLVQELVKLHGGNVKVNSSLGQGSIFTVTLPFGYTHLPPESISAKRIFPSTEVSASFFEEEALQVLAWQEETSALLPDVPLQADGKPSSSQGSSHGKEEQQPAAHILVVDDNADMRAYISRLLRPRYVVQAVADGKAALTLVKERPPNLVVADVMMPGMDGFALLHDLRSNEETQNIPVILLSARAGEEAQIEGMAAGADDYLVKPFSARELLARIEARLEIASLRQESEERFRTLAENMSQLAWMTDENGWVFWYNKRWYDYTGKTFQEVEGWGWQKVHHPDHVQRVLEKIRYCLETGEIWEDTFPLRGKDGTYRWFLSRAIPIRNDQGKVIRWFGTSTDITEQKRLEQQKDDFLGVASHELKTPVTSIKAFAQLLERRFRQSGDARSAELLQKMDMQLNKLTSLVEDLLDVTRIENGQLLFHFSSFAFNELINEIIEETQRTATRHTIVSDLGTPVSLCGDRERIGQVLINLLTNAIKYSPQAEKVLVKTTLTVDKVITSVQDFGIGIPVEKQAHLFERFYRVEGDSQRTYPGLGLGLYISAECIKRHHGSIWAESVEGQGTTVYFSLPLQHATEE